MHDAGDDAQADGGPRRLLKRLFGSPAPREQHRLPPLTEVTLQVIAHVENDVVRPRPQGWDKVRSRIVFPPEAATRLDGLRRFSHVIVVTYLDLATEAPSKPDTLTLESGTTFGILATRSQLRPNHLGVSAVPLLRVEGHIAEVIGLDAIDGTPVLDLKPYLPEYDAHPGATIPARSP